MSALIYAKNLILAIFLTLYYTVGVIIYLAYQYLKNPFSSPWAQKLRLEPPSRLTDPKYGIHQYVKVNNIKLHYVESGDSSKPLMLFLHGYPEFWYSWRHQIVEFNKNYWCIAVDMRGYGDSERPEGVSSYKHELLVEDVRDLVRHLGREKFILVSHDWGGAVAFRYRDMYPETLHAFISLASVSMETISNEVWTNPEQRKSSWYVFLYQMPYIPECLLLINDMEFFEQHMLVPGKDAIDKQDIECYKYWFGKPFALTPPLNYYRANVTFSLLKKITREGVPMLVVHGEKDIYLNNTLLKTLKEEYSDMETTILENTGHFMQQEEPEKVNELMRGFLAKHNLQT